MEKEKNATIINVIENGQKGMLDEIKSSLMNDEEESALKKWKLMEDTIKMMQFLC